LRTGPPTRIPEAIAYLQSVLNFFDSEVDRGKCGGIVQTVSMCPVAPWVMGTIEQQAQDQ
jgi:hypothetical protein